MLVIRKNEPAGIISLDKDFFLSLLVSGVIASTIISIINQLSKLI